MAVQTHTLQVEHLTSGYDKKAVVRDVTLRIPEQKISVFIGANACGKSTLLKTITRILTPMEGRVTLDAVPTGQIPPKKLARVMGLLPQTPVVPEGITVGDLVSRGRYPHQKLFQRLTREDLDAVTEAMEIMKILPLADESMDALSGGQRQRAWIATALAQGTDLLFLDEPTTYLDVNYQVEILDLMTDLNRNKGVTVVMVLHDINLAARYADCLFAMKDGKLIAQGAPKEILNEDLIREVFGMESRVTTDPVTGAPYVIPIGRYHCA